jgi:hypothetical protein
MLTKKGRFPSRRNPEFRKASLDSFDTMLVRASECVKRYESSGSEPYLLRVAANLAIDYSKCLLDRFGAMVDAPVQENQTLPRKFDLIVDLVPNLGTWRAFVKEAEALRNLVAHTDHKLPQASALRLHLRKAGNFKRDLSTEAQSWSQAFSSSNALGERLKALGKDLDRLRATFDGFQDATDRIRTYRVRLRAFKTLVHSLTISDTAVEVSLLELLRGETRSIALYFDYLDQQREDDFLQSRWEEEHEIPPEVEFVGVRRTKRRGHRRTTDGRSPTLSDKATSKSN